MDPAALLALSPIDGRYRKGADPLRAVLSESGLIRERMRIEAAWLLSLAESVPQILDTAARRIRETARREPGARAGRRSAGRRQGHREPHQPRREGRGIFRARKARGTAARRPPCSSWCISAALPKTSTTSPTRACCARRAPCSVAELEKLIEKLRGFAHEHAALAMLSRTHGQTASPTTLGKEFANVVARLRRARARLDKVEILAKWNGAVGNYNAHVAALPEVDWPAVSRHVHRIAGPRVERILHADRAARLDRRVLRRARRHQHHPHRLRARHLGLHLARLPAPARGRGRSRFLDHAAQGQPDRLRERRRQSRRRQRAAASLRRQTTHLALATRSHGLHGVAQRRRGARAQPDRLERAAARARQDRRGSGNHRAPTSNARTKCSAKRCRRRCAPPACRTVTSCSRTSRAARRSMRPASRPSSTNYRCRPRERARLKALAPQQYLGLAAEMARSI